jgi:hypothetical protein
MYIGKACPNGHNFDDKVLRYKSHGNCILCMKAHNIKQRDKRYAKVKNNKRDMTALEAYEEKQERLEAEADFDPLFDE